ncbi:hypothetical protein OG871_17985 [Kitasatospora sp. NBC_00374]|uniref:hypothetical protein n=1 Tax=Kitasatospora sp. NBC_00374 TaxID=2975964 RepID=UPI0030E10530
MRSVKDPAQNARNRVPIIVVVDAGRLDETVEALRRAGMTVDSVLRGIEAVAGSAPEDLIPTLEAVSGVEGVEREGGFQLPDPESTLQ